MRDGPWPAPGKLNLFLHIVGRRPDGYHLLQTLFQFIDRCDWLDFRVRDDGRIRHAGAVPTGLPESDLTVRAARLLQRRYAVPLGVDIRLDKRLPMGGGLGGGSSDAATTLVALNRLWGLHRSDDELAALGLDLGADVPVFVRGRTAWAEGVGERLTPVDVPEPWYVVVVPPVAVATAAVFAAPDLTRTSAPITIRDYFLGRARNVCQPVVARRHPEVAAALDWLSRFGEARLTGTGGCVFAAFETEATARAAVERAPPDWQVWVARGRNRSPLQARTD